LNGGAPTAPAVTCAFCAWIAATIFVDGEIHFRRASGSIQMRML